MSSDSCCLDILLSGWKTRSRSAFSDRTALRSAGNEPPVLFLGPTGVGKTELCKALAAFLFNDEQRGL